MADSSQQIRRLTAPIRRDLRLKIKSVAERTQFLAAIEPVFEGELVAAGLDQFMQKALRISKANHRATIRLGRETPEVHQALESLRADRRGAPIKYFRRQLIDDFHYVMELVRLLHRLDNPAPGRRLSSEEVPQFLDDLDVE